MSIRLTMEHDSQRRTLVLADGSHVLGVGEQADAVVRLPTLSRMHARIEVAGDSVRILDLGSSNGTRIGERVVGTEHPLAWEGGTVARFGQVRVIWDALDVGDDELALALDGAPRESEASARHTLSDAPFDEFTRRSLAPLLARLGQGESRTAFARALGEALFRDLPLAALTIEADDAVLFHVDDDTASAADPADRDQALTIRSGALLISTIPRADQRGDALRPVLEAAGAMLDLAGEQRARSTPAVEPVLPPPETLDPAMRRLYRGAARAAEGGLNILIHGESGTGKEVLARSIHHHGPHRQGPLVALNCAALPEDLLEAELFGIERGVATGVTARAGKFELANGGILFLDEIGDMPAATQARILRVLQEGEVVRIGASAPREISVQVVAATNQDLAAMVSAGDFRLDLFHRLADWEATIPPLRERRRDIPNLALHFLARSARELDRSVRGLSRRALDLLLDYHWPGNVRELEREMKRLAAFADPGQLLSSDDLADRIRVAGRRDRRQGGSLAEQLADEERRIIRRALAEADGNASQAARDLGISRATLYRRFAELGIEPD